MTFSTLRLLLLLLFCQSNFNYFLEISEYYFQHVSKNFHDISFTYLCFLPVLHNRLEIISLTAFQRNQTVGENRALGTVAKMKLQSSHNSGKGGRKNDLKEPEISLHQSTQRTTTGFPLEHTSREL